MPEKVREPFQTALFREIEDSAVERDESAPTVVVRTSVVLSSGETGKGIAYFAARGRAEIRLHRAEVVALGRPGVARTPLEARRLALEYLVEEIVRVLSW